MTHGSARDRRTVPDLDRSARLHADRHVSLPRLSRDCALDDYTAWETDADRPRWALALRELPFGGDLPTSSLIGRIAAALYLVAAGVVILALVVAAIVAMSVVG